jgi:hypothetical protein
MPSDRPQRPRDGKGEFHVAHVNDWISFADAETKRADEAETALLDAVGTLRHLLHKNHELSPTGCGPCSDAVRIESAAPMRQP